MHLPHLRSQPPSARVGWIALAIAAISALLLALDPSTALPAVLVAVHAGLFAIALALVGPLLSRPWRVGIMTAASLLVLAGASIWIPAFPASLRSGGTRLHVFLGIVCTGILIVGAVRCRAVTPARAGPGDLRVGGWQAWLTAVLAIIAGGAYAFSERARGTWSPPRYDAPACYRFLTATTGSQAGERDFPSALRVSNTGGASGQDAASCGRSGCHPDIAAAWSGHAHARGGSLAYNAAFADFIRRRGGEAGKWCLGCHSPADLAAASGSGVNAAGRAAPPAGRGVGCGVCHGARDVHALYGSAPIKVAAITNPTPQWLRPGGHSRTMGSTALLRAAEFCAGCHRKNWSLPQNEYRWIPGPDEYGEWQSSRFSAASLFAPGGRSERRSCVGCHDAHGGASRRTGAPPVTLDAFVQSETRPLSAEPFDDPAAHAPREALLLDVVVANTGIGHSLPFGMPDLHQVWLGVRVYDAQGRIASVTGALLGDGSVPASAFRYEMIPLDRSGNRLRHGDLDRMVRVAEWRRVPAGDADLARYRLRVPPGSLGSVSVQLLRRRRPDFAKWAGEAPPRVSVLAEKTLRVPRSGEAYSAGSERLADRWRSYGSALSAVKAFPQAIRALKRAQALAPGEAETRLALGRVYLEEGDLLAAREQFSLAARLDPRDDRARAWQAAVLRHTGELDAAAAELAPLVARYPRDVRLRFEFGKTLMLLLRNADAIPQFEAMLDVDPLDVSAHYNLMLCLQRLNRVTDARREEAVFRLLGADAAAPPREGERGEDRSLRVINLEPAR